MKKKYLLVLAALTVLAMSAVSRKCYACKADLNGSNTCPVCGAQN